MGRVFTYLMACLEGAILGGIGYMAFGLVHFGDPWVSWVAVALLGVWRYPHAKRYVSWPMPFEVPSAPRERSDPPA